VAQHKRELGASRRHAILEDKAGLAHWKAEVLEGHTKQKNLESLYPENMRSEVSEKYLVYNQA